MGGSSSSPRNVTIEEDKVTGVVKVSEAVAKRLLGGDGADCSLEKDSSDSQRYSFADEDDISNYQNRMDVLEKQNNELFRKAAEEFENTVSEIGKKFVAPVSESVCADLQREVSQCYTDNPKYPLHCAGVVKAFQQCVQQRREGILAKRG